MFHLRCHFPESISQILDIKGHFTVENWKTGLRNQNGKLAYLPNDRLAKRVRPERIHVYFDNKEYPDDIDLIAKAAAGIEITVKLDKLSHLSEPSHWIQTHFIQSQTTHR
jgi:hypothetical protein